MIEIRFETNPIEIFEDRVQLRHTKSDEIENLPNDFVYIFAGGELPTAFLEKIGIKISRRYGYAILKHKN